jgi:hypothetical protein
VVVLEVVIKTCGCSSREKGQFSENHFVTSLGAWLATMAAMISQKWPFFPFATKTWQPWLQWQVFSISITPLQGFEPKNNINIKNQGDAKNSDFCVHHPIIER